MGFVPIEKVTGKIDNKYEAILIAAREARVQNSISQLEDRDPNAPYPKVTTVAQVLSQGGTVGNSSVQKRCNEQDAESLETQAATLRSVRKRQKMTMSQASTLHADEKMSSMKMLFANAILP